jgi:hypothetical protein
VLTSRLVVSRVQELVQQRLVRRPLKGA